MAETTAIEWCDSTFNPWVGCTKISPACDHCYAESWAKRSGMVEWGNAPRFHTSEATWRQPMKWQREAKAFFEQHGRRRLVFCSSLADVFDNQVPDEWRMGPDGLWALIRECPDLDWLLLTKRPQNIGKMLPAFWDEVKGHVWLGTTVEDQSRANQNIPHLLQHDAAVRFVSIEPMLGPVSLWTPAIALIAQQPDRTTPGIDWVIAGGESGPHARPSHPDWFRSLRDQCAAAGVPFLFKQWGEWIDADQIAARLAVSTGAYIVRDGERWVPDLPLNFADAITLAQVLGHRRFEHQSDGRTLFRPGKKSAGRLLDGVEHNGFPEVRP